MNELRLELGEKDRKNPSMLDFIEHWLDSSGLSSVITWQELIEVDKMLRHSRTSVESEDVASGLLDLKLAPKQMNPISKLYRNDFGMSIEEASALETSKEVNK